MRGRARSPPRYRTELCCLFAWLEIIDFECFPQSAQDNKWASFLQKSRQQPSWPRSLQDCRFVGEEETEAVIHYQCHIPFPIHVSNGSNHSQEYRFVCLFFILNYSCASEWVSFLILLRRSGSYFSYLPLLQPQHRHCTSNSSSVWGRVLFFSSGKRCNSFTLFLPKKNGTATVTSNHFEKYHLFF